MTDPCIILGAARSGTTILGEVLAKHPQIAIWHEPYFIWDYFLGKREDDLRSDLDATDAAARFVRREMAIYLQKSAKQVLVEKCPSNGYKLDYIAKIFPNAQYIHLVRDGRAVTYSQNAAWTARKDTVNRRSVAGFFRDIHYTLIRQPFWRNRLQAIWYEIKSRQRIIPFLDSLRTDHDLTFMRGSKFPGWKEQLRDLSVVEFNALQWTTCEAAIRAGLSAVDPARVIEIRYENLVKNPNKEMGRILSFLGVGSSTSTNYEDNFHDSSVTKWQELFSEENKALIEPIIRDEMARSGYQI
jgi:hypothetical protein